MACPLVCSIYMKSTFRLPHTCDETDDFTSNSSTCIAWLLSRFPTICYLQVANRDIAHRYRLFHVGWCDAQSPQLDRVITGLTINQAFAPAFSSTRGCHRLSWEQCCTQPITMQRQVGTQPQQGKILTLMEIPKYYRRPTLHRDVVVQIQRPTVR